MSENDTRFDEGLDAVSAGYRMGYNDASHFSREFKRLFGLPPLSDAKRLREAARESTSSHRFTA